MLYAKHGELTEKDLANLQEAAVDSPSKEIQNGNSDDASSYSEEYGDEDDNNDADGDGTNESYSTVSESEALEITKKINEQDVKQINQDAELIQTDVTFIDSNKETTHSLLNIKENENLKEIKTDENKVIMSPLTPVKQVTLFS